MAVLEAGGLPLSRDARDGEGPGLDREVGLGLGFCSPIGLS